MQRRRRNAMHCRRRQRRCLVGDHRPPRSRIRSFTCSAAGALLLNSTAGWQATARHLHDDGTGSRAIYPLRATSDMDLSSLTAHSICVSLSDE